MGLGSFDKQSRPGLFRRPNNSSPGTASTLHAFIRYLVAYPERDGRGA